MTKSVFFTSCNLYTRSTLYDSYVSIHFSQVFHRIFFLFPSYLAAVIFRIEWFDNLTLTIMEYWWLNQCIYIVTLRAKLSGAVYYNRSCLGLFVCVCVGLLPR